MFLQNKLKYKQHTYAEFGKAATGRPIDTWRNTLHRSEERRMTVGEFCTFNKQVCK